MLTDPRERVRQRARLQKMGTSSSQTDSLLQSPKKPSFRLPSFRRSSAGEGQEVARSAEAAAGVQKAAAWQWYARGVGEAVVPKKRPAVANYPPSQPPFDDKTVVDGTSKLAITNVRRKKPQLEPPLSTEFPRAASRFKAEARSFARPTDAGAQPTPSPPSAGLSTPLYDELELSGLRTQMADFVQRLQLHPQTKDNEQSPALKSKPLHIAVHGPPLSSTDHQQYTKTPPSAAAAISSDHQLTKAPPSDAPVSSTIPFRMTPFSALHKLFRKVVSGSIIKTTTKNSPRTINSSTAVYEPPEEEVENTPYHYHHYIHHHHHHYHYSQSPEENAAAIIRSRRRHSESSCIRPHIPSLLEVESDVEEEEVDRSSFEAYLARRRRHSDSFAGHRTPQRAAFDEEEGDSAKETLPLNLLSRHNSESFSPNKIATMVSEDLPQLRMNLMKGRSRRRHSAENQREGATSERKAEGCGKTGGGTYKLGGAADGATPPKPLLRRRHSEVLQRPEGGPHYEMEKRTPSPGRPYWHSPSERYLEDVLERQMVGAAAPAAAARRPRQLS